MATALIFMAVGFGMYWGYEKIEEIHEDQHTHETEPEPEPCTCDEIDEYWSGGGWTK